MSSAMRIGSRRRRRLALVGGIVGAVVLASACHHEPTPELGPAPSLTVAQPELSQPELASPAGNAAMQARAAQVSDTAHERHVDVDTHGVEVDVRSLLDFVASAGNFTLVYAPSINKRVRVTLIDVPASVALQTILSLADLTIESATPDARPPGSTSVVFYQLPVNVDGLSAEAIMKRFGVGRTIAEMIVQARTANRP